MLGENDIFSSRSDFAMKRALTEYEHFSNALSKYLHIDFTK